MSIASKFLEFLSQIRLYHWQTTVYSRHIASNDLYNGASLLIDQFIETYQGKNNGRVGIKEDKEEKIEIFNLNDDEIIIFLNLFKDYLNLTIPQILQKSNGNTNSDLLNIRDEILGLVNKTLYLFSLQ